LKLEKVRTPKETEEKIIELLNSAKKFVWQSSGLNEEFYNKEKVREAITNCAKRVRDYRLIVVGDAKTKLDKVKWIRDLPITIRENRDKSVLHWLIIDGKHYRFEKPHLEEKTGAGNLICWNMDSMYSRILERRFLRWWYNSTPLG